ncbi:hypothetical protein MRB53_037879 [Persea americana]|nr:hypothetical protein MRB53_037879 [Persea americana]
MRKPGWTATVPSRASTFTTSSWTLSLKKYRSYAHRRMARSSIRLLSFHHRPSWHRNEEKFPGRSSFEEIMRANSATSKAGMLRIREEHHQEPVQDILTPHLPPNRIRDAEDKAQGDCIGTTAHPCRPSYPHGRSRAAAMTHAAVLRPS